MSKKIESKKSSTKSSTINNNSTSNGEDSKTMLDAIRDQDSSEEIAKLLGFKITQPLGSRTIWRLRKALPGYASVLKDAQTLLVRDAEAVHARGATAKAVQAIIDERTPLADAEAVLDVAQRSVREQRMLVDDKGMGVLRRINIAVEESGDAMLMRRWKFLSDYLSAFTGTHTGSVAQPDPGPVTSAPPAAPAADAAIQPPTKSG